MSKIKAGNILSCDKKLTHIDLEVTRECRLNCVHCSAAQKKRGKTLPVEKIKSILQEAKHMGIEKVGLTGGEPFLNKEKLTSIASFCRNELNLPIHIHSNGTLITPKEAKWIKQIDAEITIPLYGNSASIHEGITRKKGSFDQTLAGLRNLIGVDANVCVYIVPMKQNLPVIKPLIKMVFDEGVKRVRVLSLSPTGRAKIQFENLELSENETQFLGKELLSSQKELGIDIRAGFCTSQNFTELDILEGHDQCFAAENRIHIDTFGNVFPCTASSGRIVFSAGNLQDPENSLSSIWNTSPLLQFFRSFHTIPPKKCTVCSRHSKCMSGCRIRMSYKFGDVTIPDPTCGGPHN